MLSLCYFKKPSGKEGSPWSAVVKNLPAAQETGFSPWVGKIPWKREWQPTPVFLLGESHKPRSLVGCSPWGCKELDMTEQLTHSTGEKWREFPGQLSNSRSESHLQVEVVLFTKAQSARQVMLAFRSLFRMEILFFLFFLKGVPFSFVCLALIRTNSTC